MRTIAVLNQKGGVGKTTTVANTAAALAALGSKVVTIDFDPQAHLTIHLGLEPQNIDSGSYKVLTESARFESEIVMVRPNLWLLPANIDLVGAESELVSVVGRETILREALEQSEEKFDYCLIDCAPSLGLLTLNALAAAKEVLIPLQPHFLALQGFGKLLQTIELVNRRINPDLKVNGILLCMFDSRASLPNEVKADIERFLNDARGTKSAWAQAHVLPTMIRRNIKLAEAPSYGKTIFEYESNCHGAEDYRKVAEFIHAQTLGHGIPIETENTQEQTEQPVQEFTEVSQEYPSQEYAQEVYAPQEQYEYENVEQQQDENIEDQPQQLEQEAVYSDIQPDHTENFNEPSPENENIQDNIENNEPQSTEQSEPLQPETTNEHSEEPLQKPPIEIQEIPPSGSQEFEEHIEISEEANQSEQTNQDSEPEYREY